MMFTDCSCPGKPSARVAAWGRGVSNVRADHDGRFRAVARNAIEGYCVLGRLALDGSIATVAGALPTAIGANGLCKGLICPASCGAEAAWAAADMAILAPSDLLQLINHFKGLQTLRRPHP